MDSSEDRWTPPNCEGCTDSSARLCSVSFLLVTLVQSSSNGCHCMRRLHMMLAEEATERATEHLAQLPFHMRIIGTLFRSVDTAFEITIGLLCLGSCKETRGYRRLGPDEAAWHLTGRCT